MESEIKKIIKKDSITKIPEKDIYYNSNNNNKPPKDYFIQRASLPTNKNEEISEQNEYPQLEIIVENSETIDIGTSFIITPEGPINSL